MRSKRVKKSGKTQIITLTRRGKGGLEKGAGRRASRAGKPHRQGHDPVEVYKETGFKP